MFKQCMFARKVLVFIVFLYSLMHLFYYSLYVCVRDVNICSFAKPVIGC